jgi:hypothetical protein
MFLYFSALIFAIFLLYSCASVIEHKGACDVDHDMFFGKLASTFEENGFNVVKKDPFGGDMKAVKKHIEGGTTTWVISIKNSQISAFCYTGTEAYPTYIGDNTEKTNLAYWEIINFLEKNCNSKFEVFKN